MKKMQMMATLWPNFEHYGLFANDKRLSGIRLNSAAITCEGFEADLAKFRPIENSSLPLSFDIKGRQLRVTEVFPNQNHLDMRINHPIMTETPTAVFFKGGTDQATLLRIEENGHRLIFKDGPDFLVNAGESIHIFDPNLLSWGPQFIESENRKIAIALEAGFTDFHQSYVQWKRDVDEFREKVGSNAIIRLKIENRKGLEYVAREFKKEDNLVLVAARGDLFVELGGNPSEIVQALRLIIEKDPEACAASRLLLSVQQPLMPQIQRALSYVVKHHPDKEKLDEIMAYMIAPQPVSCADICELTWLADIGYRNFMLCDELCLYENSLEASIGAFDEFRKAYVSPPKSIPAPKQNQSLMKELRKEWGVS